ncbi:DNA uptake protein [Corynebacterium deserti GIMN1.010]|uniref:DNA uptake protein n=1 Tax=Corynebacterium deserti GIMN1.010 TaxID=931089 RepID=A0A0M4CYI8_9CORY|nr:ComEA family DNA-binding protein [Corynebacterium deserti]ALC06512.1 DNA uptake protein [Corynebacterium deserti GIMN1.010]
MKPDIAARLQGLTRPTGTEDLMRVDYPTPRFQISLKGAILAAAAVIAVVAGLIVFTDEPHSPPTMAAVAESFQTPAPSSHIVVSVVGHVDRPGLVTLPEGARIADALSAAGAREDADIFALNLAQVLVDGTQIHVYRMGEAPHEVAGAADPGAGVAPLSGSVSGSVSGLVSLNSATLTELVTLPGVGEKTAQAIIDYRDSSGGFSSVDGLLNVKGIGPSKFDQLAPLVTP